MKLLAAKIARGLTIRCWWCGEPMYPEPERNFDGRPLEADHSKSRSVYGSHGNPADRLLHHRCNRERGDGRRDHLRPALTGSEPTGGTPVADAVLGVRVLDWPT